MQHMEEHAEPLKEPKSPLQKVARKLAEAAMSVTHHDASEHESAYIHEVQIMERMFGQILRGKLKTQETPSGEQKS